MGYETARLTAHELGHLVVGLKVGMKPRLLVTKASKVPGPFDHTKRVQAQGAVVFDRRTFIHPGAEELVSVAGAVSEDLNGYGHFEDLWESKVVRSDRRMFEGVRLPHRLSKSPDYLAGVVRAAHCLLDPHIKDIRRCSKSLPAGTYTMDELPEWVQRLRLYSRGR